MSDANCRTGRQTSHGRDTDRLREATDGAVEPATEEKTATVDSDEPGGAGEPAASVDPRGCGVSKGVTCSTPRATDGARLPPSELGRTRVTATIARETSSSSHGGVGLVGMGAFRTAVNPRTGSWSI